MGWLAAVWDKILGIVPIEGWVRAVRNVLRQITLAFILIWVLILSLILNDWGFSPSVRLGLIGGLLILLFLVVLVVVILAIGHGERLYSPYERSLQRGRQGAVICVACGGPIDPGIDVEFEAGEGIHRKCD